VVARRVLVPGFMAVWASVAALPAAADVFGTDQAVSKTAASPQFENGVDFCWHGPVPDPLTLFQAIERSLCESPKTRSAWFGVKSAAAMVGAAKSAYLPTAEVQAQWDRDHDTTTVKNAPDLNAHYTQNVDTESLQLAWVLYDFGGREAVLKNSQQLLLAAQANQNEALQTAFAATATHYYLAQAAAAKVASTRGIEAGSRKILDAASARYKTGVAPITDELQTKTAYAQAVYERASAEGAYRAALGQLAIDMSLAPDTPITLLPLDQAAQPDSTFARGVHELLDEATQTHPSVLAAKAQWQAALANVDYVRSQGLPKISLQGTVTHADQPLNQDIGTLSEPSRTTSEAVGVNVTMPLFEGFGRAYKVRQAEDEALAQEQAVREAVQQVSVGVWSGVQTLDTDTENLKNTDVVVQSARDAFEAARQRYESGVGNILELLSSQTTLAAAEQQRIEAQLEWRAARLQLAASLGNLGMWALK
jgi:outer membrane protein